ncbi:GNAT family N-acetyltransferase [Streptomyces sp. CB03238]|uniref:GNAT family N-acetyltransferase n=1 Tax=Streptomyces sp. CB03238 TaxID=1907777 RepID=UPI0015C4DCDC|nr:GNAT family N-acetyltransferase [Streptomyces sp. CB03238]
MHDDRVTIRPASPSEADVIACMWDEAAGWLKSKGVDQWQYPANKDKIAQDIDHLHAYVAGRGADYLGTITVDTFADPEFWLPDDAPDSALYAHRIIVRPTADVAELGTALLDWASEKAAQFNKAWLRVDAWKTNAKLGRYYESQGFEHVRTVDLPHRRSGALYQRPAGSIRGGGPRYLGLEVPMYDANGNPEWGRTSGI